MICLLDYFCLVTFAIDDDVNNALRWCYVIPVSRCLLSTVIGPIYITCLFSKAIVIILLVLVLCAMEFKEIGFLAFSK